jgi:cobalt-zinc-cadmium efflux system outer membrane protein
MFLEKNLQLLAQHYNIESAKALVIQARKWDNPNLNTDQNVYRPGEGWFKHQTIKDSAGNPVIEGQFYVQVQQLIKTAGKRGKQINIAKTNVKLAEWQFKAVMRELRAALIKDFYTIVQLEGNDVLYNDNLEQLKKLMKGMEAELKAGNIARKEYLRVQALMVGLQQDMTENAKNLNDAESELKTMLQITGNTYLKPVAPETETANAPDVTIAQLLDSAKQNNTDYQQAVYEYQYQQQNLSLQKALAIPDVTLGPEFDQNSNYAPNYYGVGISLPLPIWDRNQGNIKSARSLMKMGEAQLKDADNKLQNDVLNSYQKLLYMIKLNSASNEQFYDDYYQLYKNVVASYNNRQISLLEFLDFFNDYKDTREKQLEQTLNLRLAKEDLNEVVGVDIIKE